ncbi:spore coat protein [Pontibacillus yanchengensis]|uniref:Spore gernimation protein GerQ n=1 Tax=Pontibacillus yanchengensis Y32 TaxID=1385514 RepID=A0A0A2TDT4_9BACI|nr:spore coat protein [Pontibacillus yanchengensis]KGP72588.1 spore gernimation protein GerQ [Pontibacillus yanchengensis Y32]
MNNQQQQPNAGGAPQGMPQNMIHGGHEVFDLHEVLASVINVLDQYMMFRQYVQDQELTQILDRQYKFIEQQYNTVVDAFSTGADPQVPTQQYNMQQSNEVVFGVKPSQPKKPNRSLADIKDQGISGHMLGLIKSTASLLTMTAVEATNPVVRRVLADSVPNYIEMAYEIFLYQNKHQYYQVPQLAQQDMTAMVNGFAKTQGQAQMPQNKMTH